MLKFLWVCAKSFVRGHRPIFIDVVGLASGNRCSDEASRSLTLGVFGVSMIIDSLVPTTCLTKLIIFLETTQPLLLLIVVLLQFLGMDIGKLDLGDALHAVLVPISLLRRTIKRHVNLLL